MLRRSLFLVLAVCLHASVASAARYAGRPLADALHDLQSRGLRLIYSDDVVTPSMIVKQEPRAIEPRRILDELLREHRLHAIDGPRGSLLIVRDEVPRETQKKIVMPVALAEIVVTPSRFEILSAQPEQRQFLGRDEVRAIPHLSDDVFRAIARIPGLTSRDESARVNIRGGAEDEVLAIVDGAEIYDPYHLKDLFRAFSTIDAEAIGSVDVLTGGFPAQYGGRMSGVIDINTIAPESRHAEAGVGLLNARVMSYGTFDDARGQWLVSFRRGYLREMLDLISVDSEVDPHYYDLIGKVQWTIGDAALASLHVLASRDLMKTVNTFDADANARYDDTYVWLNLRGSLNAKLFAQSVLSYGRFGRSRRGTFTDTQNERGSLDDRRKTDFVAWKNDASLDLTPRNVVKGGVTLRRLRARYDYTSSATTFFTPFTIGQPPLQRDRVAHVRASSTELAAYAADRMQLGERIVAELGVRVENESHTPDGTHVSPRVNVSWFASDRTIVRAAWGRFVQPEAIHELPVEDGVTQFEGAQRAEHRILGIEQRIGNSISARVELYDKTFSQLRPRFENLYNRLVIFPELRADRMRIAPERGSARGAEILARYNSGRAISGWLSYAHATVEDRIDGVDVPRSWDQRNSANFSVNYRASERWNVNVAGTWHTGWPTTPVIARLASNQLISVLGPLNSDRLPNYRRIDLRVSRNAGALGLFLELFNVLNCSNAQRVEAFTFTLQSNGDVTTAPITEAVFGVVPSFGVTWRF